MPLHEDTLRAFDPEINGIATTLALRPSPTGMIVDPDRFDVLQRQLQAFTHKLLYAIDGMFERNKYEIKHELQDMAKETVQKSVQAVMHQTKIDVMLTGQPLNGNNNTAVVQQSLADTLKLICLENSLTKRDLKYMSEAQVELTNLVDQMVKSTRVPRPCASRNTQTITSQEELNAAIREALPPDGTRSLKWNPPQLLGVECPAAPRMRRSSPRCSYCNACFSGDIIVKDCAKCGSLFFCSTNCKKFGWKNHKQCGNQSTGKPITNDHALELPMSPMNAE